jgi:hypothetical protein
MQYAIAIFIHPYDVYACYEVADSQEEAVLNALKSLELYNDQPIDSLKDYLDEMKVEVDVISIDEELNQGCVVALYDENNNLLVSYCQNQTTYGAMLDMLGGFVPSRRMNNLKDLTKFIDRLEVLVDFKEVKCYD